MTSLPSLLHDIAEGEEEEDVDVRAEGENIDDMFRAIIAGDVAVHEQPPLGRVAVDDGGGAGGVSEPDHNPPKRHRRWGGLPEEGGGGGGGGDAGERGAAQALQKRQAIEAAHLGVVDGWHIHTPDERRRGALTNLREAGTVACELCRWEGIGSAGAVIRDLNAHYESYASGEQGRSGMWDRIASIYNTRVVHVNETYSGTFIEAWRRGAGGPPKRVSAVDCLAHFTNKCGNDIVRPHRESRLHSLHSLYDRLEDELLMAPDGGAAAQHTRVDRSAAQLMLKTAVAIERTERLIELEKNAAAKEGGAGRKQGPAQNAGEGVHGDTGEGVAADTYKDT